MRFLIARFAFLTAALQLAAALFPTACLAQEATQTPMPGANVVRFDFLAPLGANLSYNFWGNHGLVLPVLASYERRLGPAWSAGAEGLLNGGDPTDYRTGAGLSVRRYLRANGSLTGPYATAVVSYRSIRSTDGYFGSNPVVARFQRVGTGLMLGWQFPLGWARVKHWTLDVAAGAVYWAPVGTDRVEDVNHFYADAQPWNTHTGFLADLRGGIGYQF